MKLYLWFSYIRLRITSRVNIEGANKLLFALTSNYRKSIIAFFYLFDLFDNSLIIQMNCNGFQYGSGKKLKTTVNIDPKSMRITVFSDTFPDATV